jgi:signal peptidase I, bacterial type
MLFNQILFWLTVATALFWLAERFWLRPARRRNAIDGQSAGPNALIDFFASLFPVILVVFLVRSFVAEPFRIPSGSMIPTLHVGDFVLVNKFEYGLRCPIGTCKLLPIGEPHVGNVVVFRFPSNDPSNANYDEDFIKRIIGVPGDHIVYQDKQLWIDGKHIPLKLDGPYPADPDYNLYTEYLPGNTHKILLNPDVPPKNVDLVVPPHKYFVMGDNRDDSYDSRYWGFVPESAFKGRAFFIWMSWDEQRFRPVLSRIGMVIH